MGGFEIAIRGTLEWQERDEVLKGGEVKQKLC